MDQEPMKLGIPRETAPGEQRVAATPRSIEKLTKMGYAVLVESGAGAASEYSDDAYKNAGATLVDTAQAIYSDADFILKVRAPAMGEDGQPDEVSWIPEGGRVLSFLWPAQNEALLKQFNDRKITSFAMDAVPRISRAQKCDALSSMANIAGYRAVLEAASRYQGFMGGQVTAAGRVRPAEVLVIGAGVAGLSAIAAAGSLGAIVRAFDVRSAAREQVESLGAEFLEVQLEESGEGSGGYAKVMSPEFIAEEMRIFAEQAKRCSIIITTALIPGRPAPLLITKEMVASMPPGSIVVDLAAEQGGNCECTVPNEETRVGDVTILGFTDLPSRMARQASQLYATNIQHLLDDMTSDEGWHLDLEDDVVRGCIVTHSGETLWPAPRPENPAPLVAAAEEGSSDEDEDEEKEGFPFLSTTLLAVLGLAIWQLGQTPLVEGHISPLLQQITIFVMACIVGWHVIWNVAPALHTPLMAVTNAISGIIIVGGMLQLGYHGDDSITSILGAIAVAVAAINVVGGFLVTERMLRMFRKE